MALAPGQPPDQEAVDRTEGQFARFGPRSRARDILEQPLDLGAGKIGVQQQAGLFGDQRLMPLGLEPGAMGRRAPVLPDDGIVDRLAALAVPDQRRLTLVGNADGGHVASLDAGLGQGRLDGPDHALPDFLWVMLHPAVLRKDLREFLLAAAHNGAVLIEHDRPARGRALINRQNIAHAILPEPFTGLSVVHPPPCGEGSEIGLGPLPSP